MARVSASSLKLLRHCAYPFRDDVPKPPDRPKSKTKAGSAVHKLNELAILGHAYDVEAVMLEHGITAKRNYAQWPRIPKLHRAFLDWWESEMCPPIQTEVAFEYDTISHSVTRLEIEPRAYPYRDGCAYGTVDAVLIENEIGTVYDTKTGSADWVDDVRANDQMLFGALCVSKIPGVKRVRAAIHFLREDGLFEETSDYASTQLDNFERWLCAAYARVDSSSPSPGDHCVGQFCKLKRPVTGPSGQLSDDSKRRIKLFNDWCPAWANEVNERRAR